MAGKRGEELPCDIHSPVGDPQHDLATIGRVGIAQQVPRRDHPLDEVGDRRSGHAHPLPELARGQRLTRILSDADVKQRTKVVGRQRVTAGKVVSDPVRCSRERTHVTGDECLQRRPPILLHVVTISENFQLING